MTASTTASAHDITVSNNTITRGSGAVVQGIFITDQAGYRYQNVTIQNNSVIGEMYNGITVAHADNVNISGNIVEGYSDMKSWIRLDTDTGVTLNNNQSQYFLLLNEVASDISATGNNVNFATATWSSSFYLQSAMGALATTAVTSSTNISLAGTTTTALGLTGTGNVSAVANDLGNVIVGNAGNDVITSGKGSDWMTAGSGTDTFVFQLHSGKDTITNFGVNGMHDVIDLSAYLNAGLHPVLAASGANTIISFGTGDTITLLGVQPSGLTATSQGFMH